MVRLWKLHGGGSEPLAAVLFIHGLDGDPHETWNINPLSSENEETFWPLWLQESFPNLAVHSIEYEASKTNWGGGHALAIEERAESLKSYITTQLRPGRCLHGLPLILITHSLGGLIAKAMLRSSSENPARGPDDLLEQTCGVVFIATPHAGSDLAWWARIASLVVRPTVAVREMVPKEPNLLGLNSWYRDYCSRFYGIRSHAFYETMDTFGAKIVDAASADPAIAGLKATPIDSDHIKIAKPLDRRAHLYLRTVDFLEDVLNDLEKDSQLRAGNDLALERRDGQEVSSQDQFGYRQIPKNAFPDCINLHVEARQGTDETRISATATLECRRAMLDGDEDLKLRLVFDSVLITLHAEGGEVSASRGLGDGGSGGRYRYVRGSRHQVAISPNDETSWLEGLVLNHAPLPEIRAFPDYPCSLEVQIGAFPEDIRIEPVGTDDKPPSDCPAIRKHMIKLVLSKDLDRLPIQYERLDRVDDQLILSRVQLSAVSDLDPANGDVPGAAAKRGIDWKAIGRILVHPNDDFAELVEAAHLDPATDFVKADLRCIDFGSSDLTGFNFEGSNLEGAHLSRAEIEKANWRGIKGTPNWRATVAAAEEKTVYQAEPKSTPFDGVPGAQFRIAEDQALFDPGPARSTISQRPPPAGPGSTRPRSKRGGSR